jgi:hypothetical protein
LKALCGNTPRSSSGTLVVAFGLRQRLSRRKNRTGRIDVGPLSESWLAEQRRNGTIGLDSPHVVLSR